MILKNPWVLLLLGLVLLLCLEHKKNKASVRFSSNTLIKGLPVSLRVKALKYFIALRMVILALFIIALARPQMPIAQERIFKEGVDIVLVLDTSTSMQALDFKIRGTRYNRLHVVKQVVERFIDERVNDRIGMVAFAGRPYIVCPLTLDHSWLLSNLDRVQIGMVEDGTAVGSSLAAALNRLRSSQAKTKIIILLTDGRNNAGKITPLTAADAARAMGVKIYTIGAGSIGQVPYPVKDAFGRDNIQYVEVDMDESSLAKIAEVTSGKYFRATDTASLRKVYETINALETTPFKQPIYRHYDEKYSLFLMCAFILLLIEQVLANTVLRKIP
ncbi:MAG: VWA domain-containing protein [Candidatus Omnitrophica bacterium]|nr:VWA domain-containing protein [Candidatus Omnitrophota bacterium]